MLNNSINQTESESKRMDNEKASVVEKQ